MPLLKRQTADAQANQYALEIKNDSKPMETKSIEVNHKQIHSQEHSSTMKKTSAAAMNTENDMQLRYNLSQNI